jgi:hypothetical protein
MLLCASFVQGRMGLGHVVGVEKLGHANCQPRDNFVTPFNEFGVGHSPRMF